MKKTHASFLFFLFFNCIYTTAQINWVAATGLNLGDTFVDGAVYTNFAGTGLDVRINVNVVAGEPSIHPADPTIVFIRESEGASMTLTFLNGTGNVVLRNFENLLSNEIVTISNPDGENITVTEVSNNGGAPMLIDGVAMPTGASPNAVIGDDSVILTEQSDGIGTIYDVSMNGVSGFTWLDEGSPGTTREGFSLNLSGVALPIELNSFTTTPLGNTQVQIDWETSTETNNDYFTIERSKDTRDWELVSIVKGQGTVLSKTSYRFIDEQPYTQQSYYRLRQTDFNGRFTYSHISSIWMDQPIQIKLFPNPTQDRITISDIVAGSEDIIISDLSGEIINLIQVPESGAHESSYDLDLSNFPTGIYFVKVGNHVQKFIKE